MDCFPKDCWNKQCEQIHVWDMRVDEMKYYVITVGCYSDYHICAVTLDANKAEKLRRFFCDGYDTADIEEFEEDETVVPELRRVYHFTVSQRGEVYDGPEQWTCDVEYRNVFGWRRDNEFYAAVVADDEEKAKKIVLDERAKQLAERFGL